MMIIPEWYFKENLKGKTVDELKSHIRSLKRKIRKLQKEMDNLDTVGCMIQPSPELQLQMHRLYLQEAMKALSDTQGDSDSHGSCRH
jgi:hypothetical protein